MVLAQFIINASNNNSLFAIGVSGKCSIRVLGVQYHDTAAAGVSRIIQVRSDSLYFPYSPARHLTIVSNNAGQMTFDNSRNEYHLKDVSLNSQVLLNVVDYATGTTPTNFQWCVLTLDIEKINEEFN